MFIIVGMVFVVEFLWLVVFCVFELVKEVGLLIIFDVDYCFYLWLFLEVVEEVLFCVGNLFDVIVVNDEEFGFMVGGIEKGFVKVWLLVKSFVIIVVYKKGFDGVVIFVEG